ncbi:MAG: HAD hydrolase family protein, partial [Vicinamibacterales bacterium]
EKIDWSHPQRSGYYKTNSAFITHSDPIENGLLDDPVQVAFNGGVGEMRCLADAIARLPEARKLKITLTEYENRNFSLLDIIDGGWSKGAALATWAEHLGIPPAMIMAIGDNLNDQEMLEYAGSPVVMGNAVSVLKTRDWSVTATNDNCGLAVAINNLLAQST